MSTDKGYIKIYRDIRHHIIWQGESFSRNAAWIDLLLRANHEDREIVFNGKKILVEKGSFITSQTKLAIAWGWGRTKVHEFLKLLQAENMITYNADKRKTIINIVNYGIYQDNKRRMAASDRSSQRQVTEHKQYTKEQDTIQERNNTVLIPDDEDEEGNAWPEDIWEG